MLLARLVLVAVLTPASSIAFHLQDPRIDEASGIAVGVRSPGVVYVQNDSGDTNRVFALDARSGRTDAVVTVTGAVNHDWEDLATAPDASGTPSLWIADTGDNRATRREVAVYRVDEPRIEPGHGVRTAPADVWRVRYPGGPVDVESLAVMPDGTPYLVTKSALGHSVVYRLPRTPDASAARTAQRVGAIEFATTGTTNPFGFVGQLTATGAAISADGRLMAVRTYADAWLWRLGSGGLPAALRRRPTQVPLPEQPQGEGVAIAGDRLLVDSEHRGSAVWSVPLTTPTATPNPSPPVARRGDPGLPSEQVWAFAVLVAVAVAAVAGWIVRRRR